MIILYGIIYLLTILSALLNWNKTENKSLKNLFRNI